MTKLSESKKITIAQLLPALENGGVERGVIDTAQELQSQGFLPMVISNGGMLVKKLEDAGIKHLRLPVHSKNPLRILLNIFLLAKIIKEYNIEILHTRSRAPMVSAYFACKMTKIKLVSTIHGAYSTNLIFKNSLLKKLYNGMMLRADSVIAVSQFIKNGLITDYKIPNNGQKLRFADRILAKFVPQNVFDKITIIARGADLNYFSQKLVNKERIDALLAKWHIKKDKKIIFFPARFTAWKGHDFLINSLKKVQYQNYLCVIAGSSLGHENYKNSIKNKILANNLGDKIKVVDNCSDMPAGYALADLVISASLRPEAFGRISIEAQAMGKIIIATAIGGSLETIIDGKTGFLIAPNNEGQLAAAIDKVLSASENELVNIGEAAAINAKENFSNQRMFAKTIAVYKDTMEVSEKSKFSSV